MAACACGHPMAPRTRMQVDRLSLPRLPCHNAEVKVSG